MFTHRSFWHTALRLVLVLALAGGAIAWVMGGRLRPWSATLRDDARTRLESLVDKSKYELNKARTAEADAHKRVEGIREMYAVTAAGIRRLERDLQQARKEVSAARADLEALEQRLESGQEVRLVSGRVLAPAEVRLRAQDYAQRIELANQKIAMLEDLLKRRQERMEKLAELNRQAPLELARLELSVRHLGEKVKLYEEQQARLKEEKEAETAAAGLFEQAQRTLEEAHAELDARLATLETLLGGSLDVKAAPSGEGASYQDVLADIRRMLDKDKVSAAK